MTGPVNLEQARGAVLAWQRGVDAAAQRQAGVLAGAGPGAPELDDARREFFGTDSLPPGTQRQVIRTNAVTTGGQDGIIVSRFFIANELAAFGTLEGDGRGPTTALDASYRFAIAWDTRTGEVSLTVSPSTLLEGTRIGEGPVLWPERPPDVLVPALPITTDPAGGPNNFVVEESGPDRLRISYDALNSVYPMGEANGEVDIRLDPRNLSVRLSGDDYPDGEFVQYRPDGTRLLGDKAMSWLQEGAVSGLLPFDQTFTTGRR